MYSESAAPYEGTEYPSDDDNSYNSNPSDKQTEAEGIVAIEKSHNDICKYCILNTTCENKSCEHHESLSLISKCPDQCGQGCSKKCLNLRSCINCLQSDEVIMHVEYMKCEHHGNQIMSPIGGK